MSITTAGVEMTTVVLTAAGVTVPLAVIVGVGMVTVGVR